MLNAGSGRPTGSATMARIALAVMLAALRLLFATKKTRFDRDWACVFRVYAQAF